MSFLERAPTRSSAGFTLIELLTTVTIVGILSAIASHQFHEYTQRAQDARAESDLRELVTAEEGFYTENERYTACDNAGCNSVLPGYLLSMDVQLHVTVRDDDQNFDAEAFHPTGQKLFRYSSDTGTSTWVPR